MSDMDVWGLMLDRMRHDIESGVYGEDATRDLAETTYQEGERFVAESHALEAQIVALEESRVRRDASLARLIEAFGRLEDERQAEIARLKQELEG